MAKNTADIEEMLEYLKLDRMAESLDRLVRTPGFPSFTPIQALREIITGICRPKEFPKGEESEARQAEGARRPDGEPAHWRWTDI